MMNRLVKIFFLLTIFLLIQVNTFAQCAMCRASVENNVANGETSIGAGLNAGILYLFVMPYLMAMVIGFFGIELPKRKRRNYHFINA
ncbi:hypothetical protein V8V91_08980 [Algoriphagus halophilus]|uniref:hypothetical protein n=1 Tax=Algoriphagus halophilus TaxID=226505 RepID=UPI00358F0844